MAQHLHTLAARLLRAATRLMSFGLLLALLSGCIATGRIVVATPEPGRLLDPTASAQPSVSASASVSAQPTAAGTLTSTATAAPGERTVQIIGLVEAIDGEIWVIDGLRVRVPASAIVAAGLGVGSQVRVVARVQTEDDDDDDGQTIVALSVDRVREVVIVGEITTIDALNIVIDGRVLLIGPGVIIPAGLLPGTIVRVVVDDQNGVLLLRSIEVLVEAEVLGGTIELIEGEIIVIGGQRLRLAPDVLLWQVQLIVGSPVRIIVIPIDGVLTIVTITIITIIVPPTVIVVTQLPTPVPTATPVPIPTSPPPPSDGGGGGGGGGGGDDDDDDDDD